MKIALALLFSLLSHAHEGHHGPSEKMAKHGGVLKHGKVLMAELVAEDTGVKIYALNSEGEALPATDVALDAKASSVSDGKGKTIVTSFVQQGELYSATFDRKSSHRHQVTVVFKYKNKSEKFVWQVEATAE